MKWLDEGTIVDNQGEGNYLVLKFDDIDKNASSVKVGLDPSSDGLVEIIESSEKNGVFKITDKNAQLFKVVISDGAKSTTKTYSLSGLTLQNDGV